MKNILKISAVAAVMLALSACGDGSSHDKSNLSVSAGSDAKPTLRASSTQTAHVQINQLSQTAPSAQYKQSSELSLKQIGALDVSSACDDQTEVTAEDMALSNDGNTIFLADGSAGLKIIDVSNPSAPKLLASLDDACDKGENKGGFGRRITISPDGNTIYLADGLAGLKIIDVSNPACPYYLGKLDTKGFSHGITVSADNRTVYIADNGEDGGRPGLRVIDVSNPYCPHLIAQRDEQWATQVALSPDNSKLFITDKKAGILVVDATACDIESATLGKYKVTDKGISADIVISKDGTKAYVANKKPGIKILDVSDATAPKLISKFDADGMTGKSIAKSIALSPDGSKLYVANRKTGVQVVDVSDASSPKLLASASTSGIAEDVMLSKDGNTLYVADGKAGIKIFRIVQ